MRQGSLLLTALLVGWLMAPAAQATCAVCICTAGATGVVFGGYVSNVATLSSGQVTVGCLATVGSGTAAYAISLGMGSGSFSQRTLKFGSSSLAYNLYVDAAHVGVWGDGTGGTSTVSDSYGVSALVTKNYPVYGRIPASQNVPAGSYTDSIMVTVTY